MHVDLIESYEKLIQLRGNWDEVYDSDPDSQFFLSSIWIFNWLKKIDARWLILAAKPRSDSARYVAFFPLLLREQQDGARSGYAEIGMAGSYFASLAGFICTPEFDEGALSAFALSVLQMDWRTLRFEKISASPARQNLFLKHFASAQFVTHETKINSGENVDCSIYPYLSLPDDWETYLAQNMGANARSRARSALRNLEKPNGLRITHANAGTFDRDLDILLELWEARWGATQSQSVKQAFLQNSRNMLRRCFASDALDLLVLWQNEVPIGAVANLIDERKHSILGFICVRDMTVKNPSPVFTLVVYAIREAIEKGFKTFDFLQGNHAYKFDYGPQVRKVTSLCISSGEGACVSSKPDQPSLDDFVKQAIERYEAGDLEQAENTCLQVLRVMPSHVGAVALLGDLHRARYQQALKLAERKATDRAEIICRSILAANPRHFDANHLLGVLLMGRAEWESAASQLRLAIDLNPRAVPALNNYARALKVLGRMDEALEHYDRAIALKPDYAIAHHNRGNLLKVTGRFEEALTSYDRAIALHLEFAPTFRNRGDVLASLGRFKEALASYDRALAAEPGCSATLDSRARALKSHRNLEGMMAMA